jgi:hypothetical protein
MPERTLNDTSFNMRRRRARPGWMKGNLPVLNDHLPQIDREPTKRSPAVDGAVEARGRND